MLVEIITLTLTLNPSVHLSSTNKEDAYEVSFKEELIQLYLIDFLMLNSQIN